MLNVFIYLAHYNEIWRNGARNLLSLDVSYDQKLKTFCRFIGHNFSWYFCGLRICLLCFNQSHPFFFIGWFNQSHPLFFHWLVQCV